MDNDNPEDTNPADFVAFAQWFSGTPAFPKDNPAERAASYRRVFGTPEGRRVLRDMSHTAGFFDIAEAGDDLSRREGSRAVIMRALMIICQ